MHFYRYFTVMNAVLPEKQHFVHQQASTPGIDQSNTRRMGSPAHWTKEFRPGTIFEPFKSGVSQYVFYNIT